MKGLASKENVMSRQCGSATRKIWLMSRSDFLRKKITTLASTLVY